ncbi:unnamed protein product [Rotaria socialis]|uniref:Uncharacterized protein n=1 Tax=Rotaria socialis TaxID=392032 RepID=A0A821UJH3_9BILA|nr:unnamed protein product [Rotaria socialis]
MVNNFVQAKQDKYGKTKGHAKQKNAILQAERNIKDAPMINLADKQNENLLSIVNNMNMELLKNNPDNDTLNDLWGQSFNIPRLYIHVLPFRVIRVLCKIFGDPVGNIFTYEIAGESLEEFDNNKYYSSHLKIISSNIFNQASVNELAENNENTVSSSDDEEDPYRLSIATPPTSTAEDERSRAIHETASTPLATMKKLSNNTKSTKSTSISSSKKLVSAHQQESAVDKIQQSKNTIPLVTRKRKPEANSSSTIVKSKQSQRLAISSINIAIPNNNHCTNTHPHHQSLYPTKHQIEPIKYEIKSTLSIIRPNRLSPLEDQIDHIEYELSSLKHKMKLTE